MSPLGTRSVLLLLEVGAGAKSLGAQLLEGIPLRIPGGLVAFLAYKRLEN